MGRPRDTYWNYAHPESDKRFKCNFCDKDFAGGISRIKSHLSGIKGRDIDICLKVPDHIRAEAHQAIIGRSPCKKAKRIISISDDDDENVFVGTEAQQHAIGSCPSNNKGGKGAVAASNYDAETVVIQDEPNSATLFTASCTSREARKKELDQQFRKCYEIMGGVSKEASQLLVQLVKGVSDFGSNYELPNLLTPDEGVGEESWSESKLFWYRGVTQRRCWKWVCEIREPNKRTRIWLGTYPTLEMAARAHDVAAIALRGSSAFLNFADSAWRLPVPASNHLKDIQKAAAEAAEAFRSKQDTGDHTEQEEVVTVNEEEENEMAEEEGLFLDEEYDVFGIPEMLSSMAEGMMLPPPPIHLAIPDPVVHSRIPFSLLR